MSKQYQERGFRQEIQQLLVQIKNASDLHNIQYKMSKIFLLLVGLIVLSTASNSKLTVQFVTRFAKLHRDAGEITVPTKGGNGQYKYEYQNLPQGMEQKGNSIMIRNILGKKGNFDIRIKVEDTNGNVVEGGVKLVVNGLIIKIQANGEKLYSYSKAKAEPVVEEVVEEAQVVEEVKEQVKEEVVEEEKAAEEVVAQGPPDYSYLYEDEVGLPGDYQVLPESGQYPATPSPEGEPKGPNIIPLVIKNSKSEYNAERDARKITIDEVKRNAAFNRQIAANKGVANLLAIIQQLTANVNAAKADIVLLEKVLADAESANNVCNDEIFKLSNTRTKIENAINSRTAKINEVNAKVEELLPVIAELKRTRDALVEDRNAIEAERSPNAARLAALEKELFECQETKKDFEFQLEELRKEIAGVEAEIQAVKDDAAGAPAAIEQIDEQIPIVDKKIEDLKQQLADAEAEKEGLVADRAMYVQMIEEAEAKVAALEETLEELNDRIPGIEREIESTQANCDRIQGELDVLREEIAANEADYKILTEEIRVQEGLIQDREDEVARLTESIAKLPNEILVLQREMNRILEALRRQYYICNDKAEAVRLAKQNLDAMFLKYNTESGYLVEANKNLEAARAEKELADQAVEEIIRSSTDANLFSIVPNGLGETDAGTPLGNNPSGSPLGPVKVRDEVPAGSKVQIGDLANYLSQAYGAGVDPTKPSTVSYLYPLSVVTLEAITGKSQIGIFNPDGSFRPAHQSKNTGDGGKLSDFGCNKYDDVVEGEGIVRSVQNRAIVVETGGRKETLEISACTQLESTKPNHVITTYDKVYFRGNRHRRGNVELQKMTSV